jgi:hypothetical protein
VCAVAAVTDLAARLSGSRYTQRMQKLRTKLALRRETIRVLDQLALRVAAGGSRPETHGGGACPTTAFSCPPICPDTEGGLC